jgi:F-type H+-transporting ATPase subunit b
MILPTIFAVSESSSTESSGILGVSLQAFVFQLITFILVFILLKKFAFDKVARILDERHKVIDEGVRHGLNMKKDREKFEKETDKVVREARHKADEIIGDAQKEARTIIRDAESAASKKSDAILADAEIRINEEVAQAKRKLEGNLAELVSEATEAIVEEKVDPKKDAELIDKALKKDKK